MDKLELINELHELLYKTASNFVKKHNLSIQSIYFDVDEMVIIENNTKDKPYLHTINYKFTNKYLLNEENYG